MAIPRDIVPAGDADRPAAPARRQPFIAILTLSAFASLFLPRAAWASTDASWIWAFVVLTVLSIVLEFVAVELPHGGVVSVATIGHIATILLVPAPFAAISVGSAVLVEELIHRRPIQRIAFNTSCHVLTISLASLAVSLIGDPRVLIAERDHLAARDDGRRRHRRLPPRQRRADERDHGPVDRAAADLPHPDERPEHDPRRGRARG